MSDSATPEDPFDLVGGRATVLGFRTVFGLSGEGMDLLLSIRRVLITSRVRDRTSSRKKRTNLIPNDPTIQRFKGNRSNNGVKRRPTSSLERISPCCSTGSFGSLDRWE